MPIAPARLSVSGRTAIPTRPAPRPVAASAAERIRVTAMGVLSFVVGFLAFYKFRLVGELYIAELLLPLLAVVALVQRRKENFLGTPMFGALALTSLLVVAGYVVTDLIRDTPSMDAYRGWGRTLIVATNFISLVIIAAQDRRNLWWFVLGFGLGGLLYLRFGVNLSFTVWKHGMGVDRGYGLYVVPLCAALAWFVPIRVAALGFVALAIYSAHYDFRTFSVICIVVAGMLWLRGSDRAGQVSKIKASTLVIASLSAVIVAVGVSTLLSYRIDEVSNRRAVSNEGRLAGLYLGFYAVTASPIVGWGSWSRSAELQDMKRRAFDEVSDSERSMEGIASTASIHAQLPQAWAEGGILASLFFLILLIEGLRRLPFLVLARPIDPLTPILLFAIVHGHLNLWGAPFAAPMRIDLALMAVALAVVAGDAAKARRASRTHPSAAAQGSSQYSAVGVGPDMRRPTTD